MISSICAFDDVEHASLLSLRTHHNDELESDCFKKGKNCRTKATTTTTTTTTRKATTTTTTLSLVCVGTECDIPTLCNQTVYLDTSKQNLVRNNLGGFGPNKNDPQEMRFANPVAGIDIKITAKDGAYKATDQDGEHEGSLNLNGARGDFGTINVMHRGGKGKPKYRSHRFRFDFVKTGTDTLVTVPSIMFTFFDIDHPKLNGETIQSCDADRAVRSEPTDLMVMSKGSCQAFGSTVKSIPNVEDAENMTPKQQRGSVVMEFHGKTGFDLEFLIAKSTRNFLFMAKPTFVCKDHPPSP